MSVCGWRSRAGELVAQASLRGTWEGTYAYDPSPYFVPPPPTGFVLEVTRQIWGRFRGTVQDDPAAGGAEVGTVAGTIAGDRVRFTKWMPVLYFARDGGVRHVAELVRDEWGMGVDGPVPAPPIHYHGGLSADGDELTGRWWIFADKVAIPADGKLYRCEVGEASGVWSARRTARLA